MIPQQCYVGGEKHSIDAASVKKPNRNLLLFALVSSYIVIMDIVIGIVVYWGRFHCVLLECNHMIDNLTVFCADLCENKIWSTECHFYEKEIRSEVIK